ncbi:sensor histidine kinase [Oerskovia flava]|uniref:sensor histidine kinase n=1 Tax=Oerskovia flava TaxID=2986422 RepID=UPI0022403E43|nr:histidine kinase [Oerskovia sp. JB1-3-2]
MTTLAPRVRSRSARDWALPIFLAAIVGVFLLITPIWLVGSGLWGPQPAMLEGLPLVMIANLSVVAGVVISRRWPGWAVAVAAWPFVSIVLLGVFVWGWWLGMLAIAVVAALDGWRRAILPTSVALLVAAAYCWIAIPALLPIGIVFAVSPGGGGDPALSFALYAVATVAVVALSAAIGLTSRSRRRSRQAEETAHRALEVQTLAAERARVARDLHDVVAHHISLVAVRAESAPYLHPVGEGAKPVLAEIAQDARGALDELRQVLTVLQRTDGTIDDTTDSTADSDDDGGGPGPERAPQPGADDIAALVEAARGAGQDVELTAALPSLPATQGYVLYRAAQEALTNARRHAPGQAVSMTVTATGDAAELRVTNPLDQTDGAAPGHLPGRGLIGMRERVEALGGSLTAQVSDDGRAFVVVATLPLGDAA